MANLAAVKSPLGLLKLLLSALLVTIVLLAAFGNAGHRLNFGREDFLGVGTSLGLAIVVPLIFISYVFGASLFVMEALLSVVGGGLMIALGVVTLQSYDHPEFGSPAGQGLAGLCISCGVLFLVNLLFTFQAIREER